MNWLILSFKSESEPIENSFYDALLQLDSVDGIEWWKLRMVDPRYDPVRKNQPVVLENIIIHGFVDKVCFHELLSDLSLRPLCWWEVQKNIAGALWRVKT